MHRLFVGNFDFEHELVCPRAWNPPAAVRRMVAERAVLWIGLADDGDLIWTTEFIPDGFWESLVKSGLPRVRGIGDLASVQPDRVEVVPWGWSRSTRLIGSRTPQPTETAVQVGNSRRHSFEIEQSLGIALPGSARIEQVEEIAKAIDRSASEFGESTTNHAWVIKANFGMAARERLLGLGAALSQSQQRWVERRLANDGAVFFEPWLQPRAEIGIQWHVPPLTGGKPKLLGVTPLLCDSQGNYRGSEFTRATGIPSEWNRAVEVCEQVAGRLQQLGYFGPLGIDAAIYEDSSGNQHIRPLQDINARYTMGRLALGFCKLLRADESGVWLHGRDRLSPPNQHEGSVREIDLTPSLVGDQPPLHSSRVLIRGKDRAASNVSACGTVD